MLPPDALFLLLSALMSAAVWLSGGAGPGAARGAQAAGGGVGIKHRPDLARKFLRVGGSPFDLDRPRSTCVNCSVEKRRDRFAEPGSLTVPRRRARVAGALDDPKQACWCRG